MTLAYVENRTNVRFGILTLLLGLLGGCAATPPQLNAHRHCPATQMLVCEDFGPERRCVCGDTNALTRSLSALDQPIGSGANGW